MEGNYLVLKNLLPFMNDKYFEYFMKDLPNDCVIQAIDVVKQEDNMPSKF
jgi:hypothetical protein